MTVALLALVATNVRSAMESITSLRNLFYLLHPGNRRCCRRRHRSRTQTCRRQTLHAGCRPPPHPRYDRCRRRRRWCHYSAIAGRCHRPRHHQKAVVAATAPKLVGARSTVQHVIAAVPEQNVVAVFSEMRSLPPPPKNPLRCRRRRGVRRYRRHRSACRRRPRRRVCRGRPRRLSDRRRHPQIQCRRQLPQIWRYFRQNR